MLIREIVFRHSQEDEGEDFAPGLPEGGIKEGSMVLSADGCVLCQQELQ